MNIHHLGNLTNENLVLHLFKSDLVSTCVLFVKMYSYSCQYVPLKTRGRLPTMGEQDTILGEDFI